MAYTKKPKVAKPIPKNRTTIEVENNGPKSIYVLIDPRSFQLTHWRGYRNIDIPRSLQKAGDTVSSVSWLRGKHGVPKNRKRKGVDREEAKSA